jgi:hypothetical protein
VRFSVPCSSEIRRKQRPVCLISGVGATLIAVSQRHEALFREGYSVLSYDQAGVGFSDPVISKNAILTPQDFIHELKCILSTVLSEEIQWILVGMGSGSLIAQCFMAHHPEKVCGFVNVDGIPASFHQFPENFNTRNFKFHLMSSLRWIGIMRSAVTAVVRRPENLWCVSEAFPIEFYIAQINRAEHMSSIPMRFQAMLLCCQYVANLWTGGVDVSKKGFNFQLLTEEEKRLVCQICPTESVETNLFPSTTTEGESRVVGERKVLEIQTTTQPQKILKDILADLEKRTALWKESQLQSCCQTLDSFSMPTCSNNMEISLLESGAVSSSSSSGTYQPPRVTTFADEKGEDQNQISPSESYLHLWSNLNIRVLSGLNYVTLAAVPYTPEMITATAVDHIIQCALSGEGKRRVYPSLGPNQVVVQSHEIVLCVNEIEEKVLAV